MPRPAHATLTDEDLARSAQQGDDLAQGLLLQRYRKVARSKGRSYFLVGGDADDIEQEALIGVYKAMRDYSAEHQVSFRAFAELCCTRQVMTAIRMATRHKHQPLNSYVSISAPSESDEVVRPLDRVLAAHHVPDPAEGVVSSAEGRDMRRAVARRLTPFEVKVLRHYAAGASYADIGRLLGRSAKSVDNAVQRIKRKSASSREGPSAA